MNEAVESYLRAKNLLYNNVVYYPYEKTLGANYYVTKFISSNKIEWGVIKNPHKKWGFIFTEVLVYDYLFHQRF